MTEDRDKREASMTDRTKPPDGYSRSDLWWTPTRGASGLPNPITPHMVSAMHAHADRQRAIGARAARDLSNACLVVLGTNDGNEIGPAVAAIRDKEQAIGAREALDANERSARKVLELLSRQYHHSAEEREMFVRRILDAIATTPPESKHGAECPTEEPCANVDPHGQDCAGCRLCMPPWTTCSACRASGGRCDRHTEGGTDG